MGATRFALLTINVPLADPGPVTAHGGVSGATIPPLPVMEHAPEASLGRPLTVTVILVNWKAGNGNVEVVEAGKPVCDRVIDGCTVSIAVPLSGPHVIVRVYAAPAEPLGPVPTVKAPKTFPPVDT